MAFNIYVYKHTDGTVPFYVWYKNEVQPKEQAKLNQKIDALNTYGEALRPQMMTDCGVTGLAKLRVHGSVQLRPKLCKIEEIVFDEEEKTQKQANCYVILIGAKEIQSKWVPKDAKETANKYRLELLLDVPNRKIKYARP